MNKTTETLTDASKEVRLQMNVEETKYMTRMQVKPGHENSKPIVRKCVTVEIFGNGRNKSKFDSGGK
jgi:hypothetical protein